MIVGKIENGLERGFVKHRLDCLLITDPLCFCPIVVLTIFNLVPIARARVRPAAATRPRTLG